MVRGRGMPACVSLPVRCWVIKSVHSKDKPLPDSWINLDKNSVSISQSVMGSHLRLGPLVHRR